MQRTWWVDLLSFLVPLIILGSITLGLLDRAMTTKDVLSLSVALAALVFSWIGLYSLC